MELPQYFDIFDPEFKEIKNPNLNQLAKEFLINKRVLIGNITHDFLSYIKYMSSESLETARFRTITKYGSLLHNSELEKIFAIIEQFILNNSVYFDNSKWDRVFNEFSIFDENGNEFRLDRLLIDTASKQILIVDYKTGSYYEQEQLDRYKKIIEKLPVVLKEGFNVKTKFVEIDFN